MILASTTHDRKDFAQTCNFIRYTFLSSARVYIHVMNRGDYLPVGTIHVPILLYLAHPYVAFFVYSIFKYVYTPEYIYIKPSATSVSSTLNVPLDLYSTI